VYTEEATTYALGCLDVACVRVNQARHFMIDLVPSVRAGEHVALLYVFWLQGA
jgi:hypothetical protein